MGIPNLNKLLLNRCSHNSIYKIHLNCLYERCVAVDISIYMYQCMKTGDFMENIYAFLSLFKYYCITPIFVFDGKPPAEKRETIMKRNAEKNLAMQEFHELKKSEHAPEEAEAVERRMKVLKQKMARITRTNITEVIELIRAFGFSYYIAPQEADQLCVHLVESAGAYAVMSDDMDIIISGCSRVIRNFNMAKHEAVLYHTENILTDLKLSLTQFREIVVLSGTDYHENETGISLENAFELYETYRGEEMGTDPSFYDWLNTRLFSTEKKASACDMLDISKYTDELNAFLKRESLNTSLTDIEAIKTIMRKHRFIFL
uniref:XPG N-terminal domain-containing protein n=1 Tax=viral metagenome TaxID=1070528 RepID=A0A6C0E255_9ZZZZ